MKKAILIAIVTGTFGLITAGSAAAQYRPINNRIGIRGDRPPYGGVRSNNGYSRRVEELRMNIAECNSRLERLYRQRDYIARHSDLRSGFGNRREIMSLNYEISRTEERKGRLIRMLRDMRSYD